MADPAFQGTRTGAVLKRLCDKFEIHLEWHPGFTLSVAEVPAHFRGPAMPFLARRIAVADAIDCAVIGASAASLHRNPEAWLTSDTSFDWESAADAWQYHKQLWHVVVRYGSQRCREWGLAQGVDPRHLRTFRRRARLSWSRFDPDG